MNEYSVLCRFIAEHPQDWERLLSKEHGVRVHREDAYAIFNYGPGCDYANPLVQEARGIILDTETLEVVCWPFRKFGNYQESYADEIDWPSARVQEKVDGSIIKLWYDHRAGGWQFSTNGVIRAQNAQAGEYAQTKFDAIIRSAENFGDIPFDQLNQTYTYIFELVSPMTQVVVPYEKTMLYHTGTRSNVTGEEFDDVDIGIKKPKEYAIGSLEGCVEAAIALNGAEGDVAAEGFVVVDKHHHRIKIKSPAYIMQHKLTQVERPGKRRSIQMILKEPEKVRIICENSRVLIPQFKFYDYQLARIFHLADAMAQLARRLYDEYSGERKAVAQIIGGHPLAFVGFACIREEYRDVKGGDYLRAQPLEYLCRLIPDYEEEDLCALFRLKAQREDV